MKFSQFAGTSIVPTLSRIVLACAFVTTGFNKLFRDAEFDAGQAETLRTLGVTVTEVTAPVAVAAPGPGGPHIVLASLQETPDEPAKAPAKAPEEAAPQETGQAAPPTEKPAESPADAATGDEPVVTPPVVPPVQDDARFTARGVHKITLMCHAHSWPVPTLMAYGAGITEFLGGALVLIGFMTRIWGLGLAITMGVAFYFVSIGYNGILETNPFEFAKNIPALNTALCQLGLFVLSFGLLTTGAGPLSLDRLLFGRGGSRKSAHSNEIEFDDADSGPAKSSRPM